MKEPRVLFPDTNFWLHAKTPFDFAALADVPDFVVAVPLTVIDELDDRKEMGSRQVRKRAREIALDLRGKIRAATKVNDHLEIVDSGVTYRFLPQMESIHGGNADDRIVAAARQQLPAPVAIVSADAGMELRAKLSGIEIITLPPDLQVPDEPDPVERDVETLKGRISKLEKPLLDARVHAEQLFPLETPAILSRLDQPTDDQIEDARKVIPVRMSIQHTPPMSPELSAYHAVLPPYADAAARYLKAVARWDAIAEAAIYVQLIVTNRSTAPVDDAVLHLRAPSGIHFRYPAPRPAVPVPPERPKPHGGIEDVMSSYIQSRTAGMLADLTVPILPQKELPAWAPRVRAEDGWIESKLGEPLRPDYRTFGGKIWIALDPDYPDEDISIPYVLYAAASGRPQSGDLVIPVIHRHSPWPLPELPTDLSPKFPGQERASQFDRWVEFDLADR